MSKRHIPIELRLLAGEAFRLQPGNVMIDTDGCFGLELQANEAVFQGWNDLDPISNP
jgi:hypothetical protein